MFFWYDDFEAEEIKDDQEQSNHDDDGYTIKSHPFDVSIKER